MTVFSSQTKSPVEDSVEHLQVSATIEYRHELVRKAIHLCSLSIPIIYFFLSKTQALELLLPVTASFLVVDVARHYSPAVSRWFYRTFGWLLRKHEQQGAAKRLSGATNVLIAACICVMVFPKILTVNAFSILIISDTTSALIGRRYGKRRFLNKSLEGSLAFFVSAVVVILVAPKVDGLVAEYGIGVVAAAVGAVAEAASGRIDDNLSIPISIGATMWILYWLFLPSVNLFQII